MNPPVRPPAGTHDGLHPDCARPLYKGALAGGEGKKPTCVPQVFSAAAGGVLDARCGAGVTGSSCGHRCGEPHRCARGPCPFGVRADQRKMYTKKGNLSL
ncbi:hypothetical protein D7X33_06850 [Butyricicoccus sp. 1XD8-22]|nr:hypothetical protein D7X33_06850 [Butyricicoccus sp. 1XD8-22]